MKVRFTNPRQQQPEQDSGFTVNYTQAKRKAYKIRWYLVLAIILSPLVAVVWLFGNDFAFVRADGIITMKPLTINSPIDGVIEKVWAKDEQNLSLNQAILRFSSKSLEAQRRLLIDEITKLDTGMEQLEQRTNKNLNNSIETARDNQEKHQNLENEYLTFKQQGLMSVEEIATLQNQLYIAKQAVFSAKQQLSQEQERLLAGSAKQWLNQLKIQLIAIDKQIEQHTISSPYATNIADLLVQAGQFIEKGSPLLILAGKEEAEIHVYLPPKYIEYGQLGRTATVTLPNGDTFITQVAKTTEIAQRIPDILSGPFEGAKPALKISLSVPKDLNYKVEGLPVSVRFHYVNREL